MTNPTNTPARDWREEFDRAVGEYVKDTHNHGTYGKLLEVVSKVESQAVERGRNEAADYIQNNLKVQEVIHRDGSYSNIGIVTEEVLEKARTSTVNNTAEGPKSAL